jgi:hypothetical protein
MTTQAKVLKAVSNGVHAIVDTLESVGYKARELACSMEERAALLVCFAKQKAVDNLEWLKEQLEDRLNDVQFDIVDAQAELDAAEDALRNIAPEAVLGLRD